MCNSHTRHASTDAQQPHTVPCHNAVTHLSWLQWGGDLSTQPYHTRHTVSNIIIIRPSSLRTQQQIYPGKTSKTPPSTHGIRNVKTIVSARQETYTVAQDNRHTKRPAQALPASLCHLSKLGAQPPCMLIQVRVEVPGLTTDPDD